MTGFAFRSMEVYGAAVECARALRGVVTGLGRPDWRAGDQLMRAALSILLNIAEGAGEVREKEKARFYRMARRSCYETAAALDHLVSVGVLEKTEAARFDDMLWRMTRSLTAMSRAMELRAPNQPGAAPPPTSGRRMTSRRTQS